MLVFTLQKYVKQETGKYRHKGLFPYFCLSRQSDRKKTRKFLALISFWVYRLHMHVKSLPPFLYLDLGRREIIIFINYFIAAGLPWVHTLNDFGVMDMPHYNFCGTLSNLRKDMLTAIKEVLIIKGVREIKFGGSNATLIRELMAWSWRRLS